MKEHAAAEKAFASIGKPNIWGLAGLATAQKKQNKDITKTLKRLVAVLDSEAKKTVDWSSPSSCYDHLRLMLGRAMVASLGGKAAEARDILAAATDELKQVKRNDVRQECFQNLKKPLDYYGGVVLVHSGLV